VTLHFATPENVQIIPCIFHSLHLSCFCVFSDPMTALCSTLYFTNWRHGK